MRSTDHVLRLQVDRLEPTLPPPPVAEQVQLQLDRAKAALSEPDATLQVERLQLERL